MLISALAACVIAVAADTGRIARATARTRADMSRGKRIKPTLEPDGGLVNLILAGHLLPKGGRAKPISNSDE